MKLQAQIAERQLRLGDPKVFSPESVRRRVHDSGRQLDRMIRLIEEMLDVSKIGAGKLQYTFAVTDFAALVYEVVDRFREQFDAAGSRVKTDLVSNIFVRSDPYRMEQVLSNLLTNAIKYAPGKPIRIRLQAENERALLSVRDEGKGIDPEHRDRIFQRFERAVAPTSISGLGLGLYISKQIVEAHQGKIWVESEIGAGSTFLIELPLAVSLAKTA